MRAVFLIVVLALFSGCATTQGAAPSPARERLPPPSDADRRQVAEMRAAAEGLHRAQAELFWHAWTTGAPVDVEAIYAGSEALFAKENLASLRRVAAAEKDPERRRALEHLERWLVGEAFGRATAEAEIRFLEALATARFAIGDESHGWRELEPMIAAEPDPERRQELQQAALPTLRDLAQHHRALEQARDEAARSLGFPGALQAAAWLRGLPPQAIEELGRGVLLATETLYLETFDVVANRHLGTELGALRRADMPRLFAAPGFLPLFPLEGAEAALAATVEGLEIAGTIRIEESAASGRPLAFAIDPPEDVRLATGGPSRDWAPLFHEGGAALQAAHVAPGPFELEALGESAVEEAFAALFENLTSDVIWLRDFAGKTATEAAVQAANAASQRLYLARRHAGRLIFQVERAQADGAPEELFRAVMAQAYGFPMAEADAAWWVVDQDAWLFGADALRGWILAAMLEEHLVGRYGEAWWRSPEAGAELVGLWAHAGSDSPEELVRRLGRERLDPEALLRQLRGRIAAD